MEGGQRLGACGAIQISWSAALAFDCSDLGSALRVLAALWTQPRWVRSGDNSFDAHTRLCTGVGGENEDARVFARRREHHALASRPRRLRCSRAPRGLRADAASLIDRRLRLLRAFRRCALSGQRIRHEYGSDSPRGDRALRVVLEHVAERLLPFRKPEGMQHGHGTLERRLHLRIATGRERRGLRAGVYTVGTIGASRCLVCGCGHADLLVSVARSRSARDPQRAPAPDRRGCGRRRPPAASAPRGSPRSPGCGTPSIR